MSLTDRPAKSSEVGRPWTKEKLEPTMGSKQEEALQNKNLQGGTLPDHCAAIMGHHRLQGCRQ